MCSVPIFNRAITHSCPKKKRPSQFRKEGYIHFLFHHGGAEPRAGSLLCCCGVEDTPRWVVGASRLHGTEWRASGDLELVCNEAVPSRGKGLVSRLSYCFSFLEPSPVTRSYVLREISPTLFVSGFPSEAHSMGPLLLLCCLNIQL